VQKRKLITNTDEDFYASLKVHFLRVQLKFAFSIWLLISHLGALNVVAEPNERHILRIVLVLEW